MSDVDTNLITKKALARRWNVDPRTIARYLDEGLPVAIRGRGGRPSRIDETTADAWRAAREREITAPAFAEARARKELALARESEQRFAIKAGRYALLTDVGRVWAAEIAACRTVILNTYLTAGDRVYRAATTDGLTGVERELKAIATEVLRELAEGPKKEKRANGKRRPIKPSGTPA